ncbi:MAG: HAD hydrolase-like protein, partial [Oscillospiraceae bacterium]|nr:HAD hydrolase-like protein [Oscillospiraceae bacterium]
NCQEGYIETYLGKIPFADAFTDIESAGRTGLSKGENIRLVMERQGITDCVYVGDTQGDADAAAQAGVRFIHAAYGFGKVDACDAVLDDIRKLPQTVKKLFKEKSNG